ncbi:SGNH/GDSL hydrolase family protein [Streptomyces sp. 7-21]|uniref:SGNH/GDSL hydrolase family protein n=1 Tax=Streptomyces sp. 7-21 TaxID=2802283 RepID=UPI001F19F3A7|nr:SGNH/GDSL hydrolase family protein [Streptomyces sp. 7-21]
MPLTSTGAPLGRARRTLLALLAIVSALSVAMVARPAQAGAQQQPAQEPVRIMPLGDSITGSPGCWRALLWQDLVAAGHTAIDFVGTLPAQNCGIDHDGDNEGHAGIQAVDMANQNQLPPWLAATNPDIVMMHLGTNDVWGARSTQEILGAFTTLVGQMRDSNPEMEIIVAQIIPMAPFNCGDCGQRVQELNAALPAWAEEVSTDTSPVILVDQWTGFDTATDTYDGVHPNDSGNRKIADAWFPALDAALSS